MKHKTNSKSKSYTIPTVFFQTKGSFYYKTSNLNQKHKWVNINCNGYEKSWVQHPMEMPDSYIFTRRKCSQIFLGFIMSKGSFIKKANKFSKKTLTQIFIIFYAFRKNCKRHGKYPKHHKHSAIGKYYRENEHNKSSIVSNED